MLGINKEQGSDRSHKNQIEWQNDAEAVVPGGGDKKEGSQGFDRRIARRNGRLAFTAAPGQHDVTQHWYVVIKRDRRAALGTLGAGQYNGLFAWQAMNDNIQKAANDRAYNADDYVEKWFGN